MSEESATSDVDNSQLYFEPIVNLSSVFVSNTEENEECLFKERAKLFRFDNVVDPPEWKERGTGYIKILKHCHTGQYRLLMRRDRTFKVCANHYLSCNMQILSNCSNNRTCVWTTPADYADEISKPESLGVRFVSASIASNFKKVFEDGCKFSPKYNKEISECKKLHGKNQDFTFDVPSTNDDKVDKELTDKVKDALVLSDSTQFSKSINVEDFTSSINKK